MMQDKKYIRMTSSNYLEIRNRNYFYHLFNHTIRGDYKCVVILCLAMMPKLITLTGLILKIF